MATTARKKKSRSRKTPKSSPHKINLTNDEKVSTINLKGDSLHVRLSRDSHPEIFDINRFIKQVQKLRDQHNRKRKMRDLCQFLDETEKSLQIILRNHLEDAMRKYLD